MPGAGSSPRVQRTMKSIKALEASMTGPDEVQPATKKAAQKLTNFRAYLHKSSVAGCFVDLLEMTSEGVMTEAGLYPSSRYKKSRSMRQAGLGSRSSRSRSRPLTGRHASSQTQRRTSSNQADDQQQQQQQQQQRGRGRRRPSTALEPPTPPLLTHTPSAPLTSRDVGSRPAGAGGGRALALSPRKNSGDGLDDGDYGGGRGGRMIPSAAAATAASTTAPTIAGGGSRSNRVTTLEVQRTQWVEGDHGGRGKGGGWLEDGAAEQRAADQPETHECLGVEHEHEGWGPRGGGSGGHGSARRRSSVSTASNVPPSAPRLAWGNAMREISRSMTKVTHLKVAAQRAITLSADERRRRVAKARAELIEEENLRAQELLFKNANRKQMAVEAAALVASQRGLLEAITLLLATKRLWAEGQKIARQREREVELGKSARVLQRAYKAHTNRRMLTILLAIRKVKLKLCVGINIRRKRLAVRKMTWFLTTGNGGAKARPRKVIRAFMYQVRRCQRVVREWLACRAASIEAVCRLWDRIESEIRRGLGDELDRAKRVWMKNALRTGEDSHMHGQWRELKAKTRSLVLRIDRLEAQIERQQRKDKAARLLAARTMLKRRQPHGLDGASRGYKRVAQMDSAENLRSSCVPSSKRLAIIRSNLNTKFSLHLQGGSRRVEQTGNRVIGEMDARLLIQGEFPDVPPEETNTSEGGGGAGTAAPPTARSTKRSRALIYTGDLGRSWQQIVEDTVMQDFRKNAFARKDSMPYLKYSAVLSLDMLAATGNFEGPSVALAAAAAAAAAAGGADPTTTNDDDGSGLLMVDGRGSCSGSPSSLEQRRRLRREGSAAGGGTARPMLEPIL
eukprot:g8170.t1